MKPNSHLRVGRGTRALCAAVLAAPVLFCAGRLACGAAEPASRNAGVAKDIHSTSSLRSHDKRERRSAGARDATKTGTHLARSERTRLSQKESPTHARASPTDPKVAPNPMGVVGSLRNLARTWLAKHSGPLNNFRGALVHSVVARVRNATPPSRVKRRSFGLTHQKKSEAKYHSK